MVVGVTLLALAAGLGGTAAAQEQPNDPSAPSGSVAPDEPPDTTGPAETTTTTEPDEATTTSRPDEPGEGTVPEESVDAGDPEPPEAVDSGTDESDDAVEALTWAAIGLTLLLVGVGVGWMLRRPDRPSGPPSDDDWPGQGELL